MHKPLLSLLMIAVTLIAVLLMLAWTPENDLVQARIVSVQRGDVHQVAALTGRIAYADEVIAYAKADGVVSRVFVETDDRVSAGEAMFRLAVPTQEAALSAYADAAARLEGVDSVRQIGELLALEGTVIRAEQDCTVRQLYVQEQAVVSAGTPVARLSSNQQRIVCSVCSTDAGKIKPDMWAWLYAEGESAGFARVESIGAMEADLMTGLTSAEVTLIPEQHLDLPENASVDVEVYLAGSDDVLTLPVEALTERETVWWVNDGRCTEIPAEIVMADEILAWVALPEGLRVAVGEFENGQRVAEASE